MYMTVTFFGGRNSLSQQITHRSGSTFCTDVTEYLNFFDKIITKVFATKKRPKNTEKQLNFDC